MSAPFKVVLPASADRDVWLAARRKGSGSSDIPKIMGVSNYGGQLHVYYDKRGELPEEDPGEAAVWGSLLEEPVAREWARRNRSVVRRVGIIARRDNPTHMCTLDRLCTECPLDRDRHERCAVEVKCRNAYTAGRWRRDVPDDVLAQVLWQLHVTGFDHIHVATLIGGNDYRQFVIRRAGNEELIGDIVTVVDRLWADIQAGRPPASDDTDPGSLVDLYQRLHPDREGFVDLGSDPAVSVTVMEDLREYEEERLLESAHKKRKDAAKARLIARLQGAEAAYLGDEQAYTYRPGGRRTPDLERLAERWPDAYADCVPDKKPRRISIARAFKLTEEDINVPA